MASWQKVAAVPAFTAPLHAADGEALLASLERRLDSLLMRSATRLCVAWQSRARRPAPRSQTAWPKEADLEAEALVGLLADALATGALESAERWLVSVLSRPEALAGRGATSAVEALIMLGDEAGARALASQYAASMAQSSAGLSLLELLELGPPADWLPGGRPHLLRWSRGIARGAVSAAALVRLIQDKPAACARWPELHLLFASALFASTPLTATRFLNRFLVAHGSPRCQLGDECSANVLSRVRFAPGNATSSGPLVSVVVAARNAQDTVGYAVASLLGQTYANLEVLVGDDASDDATLHVLQRRFGTDPRVKLFQSSRIQGSYNVRNALTQRARGHLLTFHDADDLALPDRIARQVARCQQKGIKASVGNFVRVRPDGMFLFFKDQRATRLCPVSLMLERATFEALGGFRKARIGADFELSTRLRLRFGPASVSRIRAPLMLGLSAPGSATQSLGDEALANGYRSPARRAYSELVSALQRPGAPCPTSAEIDARLVATGNWLDAAELIEV